MNRIEIIALIQKYRNGLLSDRQEASLLSDWIKNVSPEEFHQTLDECGDQQSRVNDDTAISPVFAQKLETLLNDLDKQERNEELAVIRPLHWKKWIAVAASTIILLSAGTYLWVTRTAKPAITQINASKKRDLPPGHDGAILTLADGKQVVVDSAENGSVATQGNSRIAKLNGGQLAYTILNEKPAAILYNLLTTPRGRQTSVILADGTKVWLNAASSIRYPTAFSGKERGVEIAGEAYFEIARNTTMPFMVKRMGSDESIEVLGTHFNVSAYDDEDAMRTTLLEGKVKVIRGGNTMVLAPGQQAILSKDDDRISVSAKPDIEQVMAWKNGLFSFDRADIQTVMRQIARWYDVDIEYQGGVVAQHFGGTISRNVNISQVFQMLEMTGAVKFSIQEGKILVMP